MSRDTLIAIIIPAYKEADNIKILLKRIFAVLPGVQIVVVDDSPPRENQKLKEFIANDPKIKLISRGQKLGRGSAVVTGFKEALQDEQIEYFIEMDADLAHNPAECPKLLQAGKTADLVVGSRYIRGSQILTWPKYRLIQSRLINVFLNLWLGLKLSDYTNGFRLYRRRAVEFLLKQNLRQKGFIALSEMAYKLKKAGFRVAEVPISFTDRKYGKSSATFSELITSLIGAIIIRLSPVYAKDSGQK
ncbi:MAG: polyprenol monophosphomannose synthase [Patescibacteria group bacterium]